MSNTAVLENALLPLRPLLAREDVTELVINKAGEAAIETRDGWSWETLPDLNEKSLLALARAAAAFTHQDISQSTPICSTILPSGERVQLVVPPAVPAGTVSITIRKPSSVTLTMEDFERGGLFSETKIATRQVSPLDVELRDLLDAGKHVEFFQKAVQGRKNILISGATGSGKTTLSNLSYSRRCGWAPLGASLTPLLRAAA